MLAPLKPFSVSRKLRLTPVGEPRPKNVYADNMEVPLNYDEKIFPNSSIISLFAHKLSSQQP